MEPKSKTRKPVATPAAAVAVAAAVPSAPHDFSKPLTDPADLFHLLGRMLMSLVLFLMTVFWIIRTSFDREEQNFPRNLTVTVTTGVIGLAVQLATAKLWRRLREQRVAAEAERAAALAERERAAEADDLTDSAETAEARP